MIYSSPFAGRTILDELVPPYDVTPLLTRLAELTGHPEIVDQANIYGRAVQIWAAGVVIRTPDGREADRIERFETQTDDEVEFCVALCRENVCQKYQGGVCRPSCGSGMITAVKARMASEGCPWTGKGGLGPRW